MKAHLTLHHKAESEIYKAERSVKAAFFDFCHHFRSDPDQPGLDLKPLKGNSRIFRAKVGQSFRALLVPTGRGGDGLPRWLVVALRDRKDVYDHLDVAVNRVTGEIEFIDLAVVGDSVLRRAGVSLVSEEPEPVSAPAPPLPPPTLAPATGPLAPATPLLDNLDAETLRELGVADALIDLALAITSSAELDTLVASAPLLSKDVLYGLAAGMTVGDVRREITAPVEVEHPDPDDLSAAEDRTPVTTVDEDIQQKLDEGDFRAWKVFLHPAQQRLATRSYSGPARVSGGPGTGKTVVALHRVRHLAQQLGPGTDRPILLTTFTKNLATDLRLRLESLLEPNLLARVDVAHIDQLAARVISENAPRTSRRRIDAATARARISEVCLEHDDHRWSAEFLYDEWDQVILGQGLTTRREYFEARRAGRGTPLTRPERDRVWKLIEQLTARLDDDRIETWGQAAQRAARYEVARAESVNGVGISSSRPTEGSGTRYRHHRFRHVVVDEAQDLSPAHWTMLRAMVAPGRDDLFVAGDTHQRIYDNQVTLGTVGVHVRGRASRLTLSYRTTREILIRATGIVAPGTVSYDDLDDGTDTVAGYRSVLRGPDPDFIEHATWDEELSALAVALHRWRNELAVDAAGRPGPRGSIAVCVADRDLVTAVITRLAAEGISTAELTKDGPQGGGDVHVGTMHRFKGLEYQRLAVAAAREGVVPRASIEQYRHTDPHRFTREERKDRSLLFVAATRARDTLRVSWHGEPSRFLSTHQQGRSSG